jgi:glycosyltransferase involved in cell wall biosynthesis
VFVGDGPEARRLERIAGPTVRLEGRVSDDRLRELVCTSRGLVVTAVEEFGMAAVEAQAAGRPVLAPDRGGGLETVVEGETGRFYAAADVAALTAALAAFELADYDPAACIANAERFSVVRFGRELTSVVADAWERRESGPAHDERALPGVLRRLAVTDAPHVA